MNKTKGRVLLATLTLLLVTFVSTGHTYAQTPTGFPGWGFGDKNHVHVGPPGISIRPGDNPQEIQAKVKDFLKRLEEWRMTFLNDVFHFHFG